jgi:hypothetical protein
VGAPEVEDAASGGEAAVLMGSSVIGAVTCSEPTAVSAPHLHGLKPPAQSEVSVQSV